MTSSDATSSVRWDDEAAPSGDPSGVVWDEDKFGTPGQQVLTGVEGLAKGLAGPVATGAEAGLSALGVPGLSPAEQEGRAAANPWIHGGAEAAGFVAPAVASLGASAGVRAGLEIPEAASLGAQALSKYSQAGVLGQIGEAAAKASGFEGGTTLSKIAASGIRTGAEMAALQAGDEVSKLINQDPNQSLGSAAINVGLSGIIGGAGGAVIGSVSPLWKASMEKIGVPKLIDDAKAQYGYRQSLPNGGDVPAAITDELTGRMSEVDQMREQTSSLKGKSLERAMPEVTPENSAKIDAQIQDISTAMTNNIAKASDNAYLKGAVPKLTQDFQDFLEVVTDPKSSYAEKFDAIDELKRAQQAKARYNMTAEDTAVGAFTKSTARDLRLSLEDSKVWGDAADVQRKVNAAIKDSIDAEKDAASKFTSKVLGDRVADPTKVNTLVTQSLKGTAGLKTDIMQNYLDSTQGLADTINKIHLDAGLEAPVRLTPTPATEHTLGRSSPGTTLGNWLFDKGLATVAGHAGGEAVGAGLGSLIGHPMLGAIAGEKLLAPALTSIAKPLLETASHSEAFKGSLDYVASVIKGGQLLSRAAQNIFKSGAEVVPKHLIPDAASREKLEKSLDYASNPDKAMNIGGNLGHYLPNHATAAAATAATAGNYLKALKPTQAKPAPLDKPAPIDKGKQQQHQRALEIAQQPLMVLDHVKHGTLQAQDVQTLKTIYPNLYGKMASQSFQEMTNAISKGQAIPYRQRQSLSLLLGQPLDSTLTQTGMAGIMAANASAGPPQPQQGSGGKRVSKATANSMEKSDKMYATPQQARAASRSGS